MREGRRNKEDVRRGLVEERGKKERLLSIKGVPWCCSCVTLHYAFVQNTKHSPGGKTSLQAYGALVFHLSNKYSYGDAYWVCS